MEEFIALHQTQLQLSGIPERYWETIYSKIKQETFDAGDWFMMQLLEDGSDYEDDLDIGDEAADLDEDVIMSPNNGCYNDGDETEGGRLSWRVVVSAPQGIDVNDPQHVYLIDHAWTYRLSDARAQLENNPALLRRMCALMNVKESLTSPEQQRDDVIEDVLREMWKYNQTYNIATAKLGTEAALPVWYIMDEFGSRVQHSDEPSVVMVPFCYVPTQTSYTILWPQRNLMEGEEITRDYLSGRAQSSVQPLLRKLLLLPWQPDDMRHLTYDVKEDPEIFSQKYTVHKTVPSAYAQRPTLPVGRPLLVYCDFDQVRMALTDERFLFVDTPEEADIIWTRKYLSDFKEFSELTPNKFISQFPFEMVLTVKDMLAVVARRAGLRSDLYIDRQTLESRPLWIPTTFNLRTELSQFVSYFQHRAARGLDNYWICKPFNLARGLDHWITDDLNCILRLAETGPKIASKYVVDPVLLHRSDVGGGVKFDLRFIVMVISVSPVELVVHQKFIVRVANKTFSLDHFDDYEKHFTVMNYKKGVTMRKISCEEFVEMFELQYPDIKWNTVLEDIYGAIRELFTAAVVRPPPAGISPSPQSRAIYGVDVMLRWADEPQATISSLARSFSRDGYVTLGDGSVFRSTRHKNSSESSGVSVGATSEENIEKATKTPSSDNSRPPDDASSGSSADLGISVGNFTVDGSEKTAEEGSVGNTMIGGITTGGYSKGGACETAVDKLTNGMKASADGGTGLVEILDQSRAGKVRAASGSSDSSSRTDEEIGVTSAAGEQRIKNKNRMNGKARRKVQPVLLECNFGPDNTRLINSYPSFMNDIFSTLFFLDIEGRPVDPL